MSNEVSDFLIDEALGVSTARMGAGRRSLGSPSVMGTGDKRHLKRGTGKRKKDVRPHCFKEMSAANPTAYGR